MPHPRVHLAALALAYVGASLMAALAQIALEREWREMSRGCNHG